MTDDAEVSALIKAERARLAVMFILFAISRDIEAQRQADRSDDGSGQRRRADQPDVRQRNQQWHADHADHDAATGGRFPVAAVRGCAIVHGTHHGDGGPDTAPRTPAHALTVAAADSADEAAGHRLRCARHVIDRNL